MVGLINCKAQARRKLSFELFMFDKQGREREILITRPDGEWSVSGLSAKTLFSKSRAESTEKCPIAQTGAQRKEY